MRTSCFWIVALVSMIAPGVALAHGGRPQTYDALFGASDLDIVVPGTFGVMATLDGGATWDWICIEGMPDARRGWIRPATRTADGTILFAQTFGLLEGRARACDPVYDTVLRNRFVADVTARPGGGFAAVTSDPDMPNHVHVSASGTEPFAPIGDAFPTGLLPERLRYAPSDATRLYVTGETMVAGTSTYTASLLVSSDGGLHYTTYDVPLLTDESVLRVVAVDPRDPDHAFVVAQSSSTDRLIEITMAGAAQTTLVEIGAVAVAVNRPFALGFAQDGTIWFGNTMAGLYRILPGEAPDSIDKYLHVACIVPHGDDVYLCGDGLEDDFALGVQHAGLDYAPVPLMQFAQLVTQRTCDTALDGICMGWWNDLLTDTGRADLIPPDAGAHDTGPLDIDAGAAEDAATARMDASVSPPAATGCGCSTAGHAHTTAWPLVFLAALSVRARRRRRFGA